MGLEVRARAAWCGGAQRQITGLAELGVVNETVTVTVSKDGEPAVNHCLDKAAHIAADTQAVNIDTTSPTIGDAVLVPTVNSYGWWNDLQVTVTWGCSDVAGEGERASGVAQVPQGYDRDEGADQKATGECFGKAGNKASAEKNGVNIDRTAPTIEFVGRTPTKPASGWHNTDVTLTWKCSDQLGVANSGVVSDTVTRTLTAEGPDQRAHFASCVDKAGNNASAAAETVNIDKTRPKIEFVGRTPPKANANGWYNTDVTLTWKCSDPPNETNAPAASGVVSDEVTQTLTAEGNHTATGTCTDQAANTRSNEQTGINIDKKPPKVTIVSPADMATFDLEQVVAASYSCDDPAPGSGIAPSGIASCDGDVPNGGPLDTANAGQHTFTVKARDKADNEPDPTPAVSYKVLKAPTKLVADPLIIRRKPSSLSVIVGDVRARLTYGPAAKPAVGRKVVFTAGSTHMCTGTTGTDGTATWTCLRSSISSSPSSLQPQRTLWLSASRLRPRP